VKIMIRATNWVGDAIMAIPALRAVRERFANAYIAVLAQPYVADIYEGQGLCDELIPYDRNGQHRGVAGRKRLIDELRNRQFDTALLLQNAFDAAWIAWRAGIRERIGYARDGRSFLLTKAIPLPKPGEIPPHEKFYYLEMIRRAGWVDSLRDEPCVRLAVESGAARAAEALLVNAGAKAAGPRLAIGAGASYGSAKCWPPERFAEAINRFRQEHNWNVILFGTTADAAVSAAIAAQVKGEVIDLIGKTTIRDLPALLSRCDLFLGNDSGAMHVAAAVGLPVVAVFGPTDPLGTAPVTPNKAIVESRPYCSPCFLRRCPTDHRCMKAVTPEMVITALEKNLAEARVG